MRLVLLVALVAVALAANTSYRGGSLQWRQLNSLKPDVFRVELYVITSFSASLSTSDLEDMWIDTYKVDSTTLLRKDNTTSILQKSLAELGGSIGIEITGPPFPSDYRYDSAVLPIVVEFENRRDGSAHHYGAAFSGCCRPSALAAGGTRIGDAERDYILTTAFTLYDDAFLARSDEFYIPPITFWSNGGMVNQSQTQTFGHFIPGTASFSGSVTHQMVEAFELADLREDLRTFIRPSFTVNADSIDMSWRATRRGALPTDEVSLDSGDGITSQFRLDRRVDGTLESYTTYDFIALSVPYRGIDFCKDVDIEVTLPCFDNSTCATTDYTHFWEFNDNTYNADYAASVIMLSDGDSDFVKIYQPDGCTLPGETIFRVGCPSSTGFENRNATSDAFYPIAFDMIAGRYAVRSIPLQTLAILVLFDNESENEEIQFCTASFAFECPAGAYVDSIVTTGSCTSLPEEGDCLTTIEFTPLAIRSEGTYIIRMLDSDQDSIEVDRDSTASFQVKQGLYDFLVTDPHGCEQLILDVSAIAQSPDSVDVQVTNYTSVTPGVCDEGSFTFNVTTGTWSNAEFVVVTEFSNGTSVNSTVSSATSFDGELSFSGFGGVTYTPLVLLYVGATVNHTIKLPPIQLDARLEDEPLSVSLDNSIFYETCFGDNDISFSASVSGGSEPYSLIWRDMADGSALSGSNEFDYSSISSSVSLPLSVFVSVTDARGCEVNSTEVNQLEAQGEILLSALESIAPSCKNTWDGVVSLNVTTTGGNFNLNDMLFDWYEPCSLGSKNCRPCIRVPSTSDNTCQTNFYNGPRPKKCVARGDLTSGDYRIVPTLNGCNTSPPAIVVTVPASAQDNPCILRKPSARCVRPAP